MLSFNEWMRWTKSQPWYFKWFVILILIRPIVDNFYYLKEVSPFLSPLYWIGVITPVLCIRGMVYKKHSSIPDKIFGAWSFFVLISTLFVILYEVNIIRTIQFALKLTLPLYLFFFIRRVVRSKIDLHGILTTFLYSTLFVVALMLYEALYNPISIQVSRGLERSQGGYGDVMNYSIYMSFGLIISMYFFLLGKKDKQLKFSTGKLLLVYSLVLFGLFRIYHVTTILLVLALSSFFLMRLFHFQKEFAFISILFIGIAVFLIGDTVYEETVNPLIEKEIQIIEGERDQKYFMHGRLGRWQSLWEYFSTKPFYAQFLGYPLTLEYPYGFIGINVHSDYLRILFFTGYLGFFFYIFFLYVLYKRMKWFERTENFLGIATLIALLIYSITTLPTLYAPLLYPLLSVLAYFSLPFSKKKMYA